MVLSGDKSLIIAKIYTVVPMCSPPLRVPGACSLSEARAPALSLRDHLLRFATAQLLQFL